MAVDGPAVVRSSELLMFYVHVLSAAEAMDLLTRQSDESALDVLSRAALMLECNSSAAPHQQPGNAIHYHSLPVWPGPAWTRAASANRLLMMPFLSLISFPCI